MTALNLRGGEPRAADTATPPRQNIARPWRGVTGRARTYAAGTALFVAAVSGAILGLPRPIALAVFAAGLLTAASAVRPDRGTP